MKIGHEFTSRGQRFRCVGSEDYLTLRDQWVELIKLEAVCADCRRRYSLKASMSAIRRSNLKRRCDSCKSPGVATRATKALQQKQAAALVAQDYEAQKAVKKAMRLRPQPRRALPAAKAPAEVRFAQGASGKTPRPAQDVPTKKAKPKPEGIDMVEILRRKYERRQRSVEAASRRKRPTLEQMLE